MAAWRHIAGLRDPDRFEAWLHRLLVRSCYREAGRTRRQTSIDIHVRVLEASEPDMSLGLADRDQIERGFSRLDTDQRAVLVLHYYLGLRLDEAAEVLGVPPGTVRSRLHRAIVAMRAGARGGRPLPTDDRRTADMTARDDFEPASPDFDRLMTGWFETEARVREPIDLIDRTTARTHAIRPRPAWLLPERWIPMELTMRRVRTPQFTRYAALLAAAVLLVAIALAVIGSQPHVPAPFGPARNGLLTYATPSGDIATVDPVTGLVTTIVGGPEIDRAPVFSRDGTRIAFIRQVAGGDEAYVGRCRGPRSGAGSRARRWPTLTPPVLVA